MPPKTLGTNKLVQKISNLVFIFWGIYKTETISSSLSQAKDKHTQLETLAYQEGCLTKKHLHPLIFRVICIHWPIILLTQNKFIDVSLAKVATIWCTYDSMFTSEVSGWIWASAWTWERSAAEAVSAAGNSASLGTNTSVISGGLNLLM